MLKSILRVLARPFRRGPAVLAATPAAPSTTDTEFCAEVVRITEILPHAGADRLELARFELQGSGPSAYEVVVRKDEAYKPGDLAMYFGVDCLLPLDRPEFAFLADPKSSKVRTHHRLKAARLRGVFSQGLLVRAPSDLKFGDGVTEQLGVGYFRPEADEERGSASPNTNKPARPQPMVVYGVDSLKKCPRLFEEGEPVVVTEKIHGCNARFGWIPRKFLGIRIGWEFVVGSHRVMKGRGTRGYCGEDLWCQAAQDMRLADRTAGFKGLAFYGELYGYTYSGKAIQDLTYGRGRQDGPGLMIFDVRKNGEWLSYDERQSLLGAVGLDSVLLLAPPGIAWSESVKELAEGTSTIDGKTVREGIVVESMTGKRRKGKFVSQGYLLRREDR